MKSRIYYTEETLELFPPAIKVTIRESKKENMKINHLSLNMHQNKKR